MHFKSNETEENILLSKGSIVILSIIRKLYIAQGHDLEESLIGWLAAMMESESAEGQNSLRANANPSSTEV